MFDRKKVREINAEIEAAIAKVATKHGLDFKMGNSRFSKTEITTKYTVSIVGEAGVGLTKEARNWDIYAPMYGIKDFHVGDKFSPFRSHKVFTIIGWNARSPKYSVLAESDGKTYKLTPQSLSGAQKI